MKSSEFPARLSFGRFGRIALASFFTVFGAAWMTGQDAPAPTPTPAASAEAAEAPAPARRPPEGERIINLPSADVPPAGTLSVLFTHRFSQPLEQSDIHSLYSFDSGADIGIGLAYSPFDRVDIGLYRTSNNDVYEVDVKARLLSSGPFAVSARVGGDWRTERGLDNRSGVFAQAIAAFSIGSRVRFTVVPTYVSKISEPFVSPRPLYKNVFNVPAAVSIEILRTVNVQGEIVPRNGRADSPGVGWIASIEKTVTRHRFAFTVGNTRGTSVDQYVASQFAGQSPHNYFIGFNLVRQWKL